ncbi:flagellar basal body rod protein FlgB [Clostridium pasteurianum DSM 525 = ATCC 6013]|uniref:Flagellar basal body rod protein FlgB n=1 Tax=Clostridium pasteurianum DSM 525 = ATCC 6013 TaxID=1262449 RepID=A0A0H3J4K6_CLOPA|nr:flagellar basal body rod protein FlgB [Clostridium pasteurianum]AJA47882.1 flagellar basal body rod protein FlgB [Clostridium pasteurianum DSM 525 = ATCC 6013]AJA51870.1 flagellar basal body rod protein FlgB [Clostridium pasteurianum DSM 525 = ATCC 6013]AOZ75173.1 flagellar biosynthesis protein FlgB [Clostridium pasteurianum DSM 525 = ATCC 6013]AOZ78968.1 flagellar biosynthesis protein FlgB [Clostridium pasteurianum]ELP59785.1 flagellar basal body rod protein FlgB [Clostridium pasteurianum 
MTVNNISGQQITYDLIKKSLDASSTRADVISNNIANINTAGYKRRYVTFEDTLKQSLDNITMKKDNSLHMDDGNSFGAISVKEDSSSSMKVDGNNVDIDSEMANQAQNTLMYQALTSQASSRISMRRYVITGGGN